MLLHVEPEYLLWYCQPLTSLQNSRSASAAPSSAIFTQIRRVRFSRKWLLVFFTGLWGLWTCAIDLVETLPQLVLVRSLSALGLGVFVPAAFSLIGDLFDAETRGRATGTMRALGLITVAPKADRAEINALISTDFTPPTDVVRVVHGVFAGLGMAWQRAQ